MWIFWVVLGFFGLGYVIKNGIFNSKLSPLERVTYAWLSLPLIAGYLLIAAVVLIVPIIAIIVFLQDVPVLGVFMLVGVILVAVNVIKNWNSNYDNGGKNAFSEAVERVKTTSNKTDISNGNTNN